MTRELTTVAKKKLILEGDPDQQLEFAMKAANTLMKAVSQKPKKVIIRGEQYLEYGDWQTLARFFGATAAVEWSKPLYNIVNNEEQKGQVIGYEARAIVKRNGVEVSSAEAMCMRAEKNWKDRDEFMLRSMAQTRASAKALRNAYGWVAELAGMKSTPAEEMGDMYDQSPISDKAVPTVTYDNPEDVGFKDRSNNPVATYMGKKSIKTELEKKKEIMTLVDAITLHPLEKTAEAYQKYVFDNTMMLLTPDNYDAVIGALTKKQHGEDIN